jgi:hypothetical protein
MRRRLTVPLLSGALLLVSAAPASACPEHGGNAAEDAVHAVINGLIGLVA